MRTFKSARRHPIVVPAILMTLSVLGCQTWHVETVSPESLLANRKPLTVRVLRTSGSKVVVDQAAIRADTLVGIVSGSYDNREIRIPMADVRQIESRHTNEAGTFLLVLTLGVIVIAAIEISHSIQESAP